MSQTYDHAIDILRDRIRDIESDILTLTKQKNQLLASLEILKPATAPAPAPAPAPRTPIQELTDYVKKCRGPNGKVRFGAAKPRPVRYPDSMVKEELYVGKDYLFFHQRMGEGTKVVLLDGTIGIWMDEPTHERFVQDKKERTRPAQTTIFDPPASS